MVFVMEHMLQIAFGHLRVDINQTVNLILVNRLRQFPSDIYFCHSIVKAARRFADDTNKVFLSHELNKAFDFRHATCVQRG